MDKKIIDIVEQAFENIENINSSSDSGIISAINETINNLDSGKIRVAEKNDNEWIINQWVKKSILLYFRINDMKLISNSPGNTNWWDKIDSKFSGMGDQDFKNAGFRAVPGSISPLSRADPPNRARSDCAVQPRVSRLSAPFARLAERRNREFFRPT